MTHLLYTFGLPAVFVFTVCCLVILKWLTGHQSAKHSKNELINVFEKRLTGVK